MLTQRTEGLYRLFLFCQIIIVATIFWLGVWIMVTFYSPGGSLTWGRYSIYCGMLVLRLTLETLSRSKNFFLQNELLRPHRLSPPANGRQHRTARALSRCGQRRIHFTCIFVQFCAVALYCTALFALLSPSLLAWGIFRREDKINVEATLTPRASGT